MAGTPGFYRFAGHTADFRMYVEASTLSELFTLAMQGMFEKIAPDGCAASTYPLILPVSLQAPELTVLLIDFLSELLTESHIRACVFCKCTDMVLDPERFYFQANILGVAVPIFAEDIKAVTYHEAQVRKDGERWSSWVIFDI